VGCVLVHDDKVIAKGMNATNVTRNGTRHAEFMALSALLSQQPIQGTKTTSLKPKLDPNLYEEVAEDGTLTCSPQPDAGNEDGSKGHLYPYGQKIHPDATVDRRILTESTLYVTVEPCIMCASLLRQLGIKKVFFGAVNDKFGGTGGVFSIHANSLPVSDGDQAASAHPQPPPIRLPDGGKVLGTSFPPGGGDGGNVERGYEIEGGWGRDEAVGLLRRFYVQENGRGECPKMNLQKAYS
jgi:tRNA-specific adenosine deaminase 2